MLKTVSKLVDASQIRTPITLPGPVTVSGAISVTGNSTLGDASTDTVTIAGPLTTTAGNVVINESGGDFDFRVESDTNTHALFVDAGNNCVNLGTSTIRNFGGVITPTLNSAGQLFISGLQAFGAIRDFYNGGSGRTFTISGGANGSFASFEFVAINSQGFVKKNYSCTNSGGNWTVTERESVTSGTAQTVTVTGSGTPTVTVNVLGSTPNNFGGILDFKINNQFTTVNYVSLTA